MVILTFVEIIQLWDRRLPKTLYGLGNFITDVLLVSWILSLKISVIEIQVFLIMSALRRAGKGVLVRI